MKRSIIYLSASIALASLTSFSATAIDLGSLTKSSTDQLKSVAKNAGVPLEANAMIQYAAKQLNLPKETISAGLGSLLKVAQSNLSQENFSLISKALPDTQSYLDQAPDMKGFSMNSLLSTDETTDKKTEGLEYLKTTFKKLGMSKKQIPGLVNTVSGYLESSGYEGAASALKKGLNFL